MENVPTVVKHAVFDEFVAELIRRKYKVWHEVVDCAEYGLPQRRRRTVLLASLLGPIELDPPAKGPPVTVRNALKSLPELKHGEQDARDPLHTASSLSPLNSQRIRASKPASTPFRPLS